MKGTPPLFNVMKRIGIDARKIDDFGIGTYIRCLLEQYLAQAAPYQFVLFGPPDRLRGLFQSAFEIVPFQATSYSLIEQWELPRLIDRTRLDLFHSPHYVTPIFTACPLVVTIHDLIHLRRDVRPGFKNWLVSKYARPLIHLAVRKARQVITVSHFSKADIEREFPAAVDKTKAIHNGILRPVGPRLNESELQLFREHRNLLQPLVLFVGNPMPHKNLEGVFAAVQIASDRGCPVSLALAGCQPGKLARFGTLPPRVSVLGYLSNEDLHKLYCAADVLILPSLYEGFGLTIVEAMAAGLPVITSNVTSMPEIAGNAAITIDPRDYASIADALIRVIREPSVKQTMITKGRLRAADFSWEVSAEQHLAAYALALLER